MCAGIRTDPRGWGYKTKENSKKHAAIFLTLRYRRLYLTHGKRNEVLGSQEDAGSQKLLSGPNRRSHHIFKKPGARSLPIPVHHGKVHPSYVRMIKKLEA